VNDYILSIILGVIEGLTEFLPISSTAHLRIAEKIAQHLWPALNLNIESGYWKMYTIVIQLGAILVLPIYFRREIWSFSQTFPNGKHKDKTIFTHPLSLTLIAFVFTGVPSFLLTKLIGKNLDDFRVMGGSLVIGGIVMWVVDAIYGAAVRARTSDMNDMSLPQAVWIGACQTLSAIFPGTSRSMATIAAGQVSGMTRSAALEFSFFLSIPTMIAATGYDLLKTLRPKHVTGGAEIAPIHVDQHGWVLLAIGFVVSFIVAYMAVAWFMRWVRTRGFVPFAVYRILAGGAVLWWAMHR
jgi:undecaprenyl-diphosphatase